MTDEKKLYKVVNKGTKNQIDEMLNYIYDKYKPLLTKNALCSFELIFM